MYQKSDYTPTIGGNLVLDVSFQNGTITEPVSLEDVARYMRVDYPDEYELIENTMITAAREWVEKVTCVSCIPRTVTAVLQVMNRLELPYGPVTDEISYISVEDCDGNAVNNPRFIWGDYPRLLGSGVFTLTYSAGYTASELPKQLKIAIMARVLAMYEGRGDEWVNKYSGIAIANTKPYSRVLWG